MVWSKLLRLKEFMWRSDDTSRLSFVTRPWVTYGLLLSVTMSGLLTTPVQAEWYFGGYGGIANPGAFSNVTVSDPTLGGGVTNARINDLELKSTFVGGGAKAGYFFEQRPWLGKETGTDNCGEARHPGEC
jgi:hypothetical protein